MKTARTTAFLAACLLSATAWAQSSSSTLNLKIPANVPAAPASTATPVETDASRAVAASTTTAAPANQANPGNSAYAKDPPGTYYGDTSGRLGDSQAALSQPAAVTCDDATYNQPQVHGAVSTGVMAGSHTSGSYTAGGVTLSQAFGSCQHPTGGMSISVSGGNSHYGH